jgi:hypothetical protein
MFMTRNRTAFEQHRNAGTCPNCGRRIEKCETTPPNLFRAFAYCNNCGGWPYFCVSCDASMVVKREPNPHPSDPLYKKSGCPWHSDEPNDFDHGFYMTY